MTTDGTNIQTFPNKEGSSLDSFDTPLVIPARGTAVVLSDSSVSAYNGSGLVDGPQVWRNGQIVNTSRLKNLTRDAGQLLWLRNGVYRHSSGYWLIDRILNSYDDVANKGIRDAFVEATARMSDAAHPVARPVVRLYRPGGRESRAFQYLESGANWTAFAGKLNHRNAMASDRQVADRAPLPCVPNRAFKYVGELGRLWRFNPPRYGGEVPQGEVFTERIENAMRDACGAVLSLPGSHGINNPYVRRILADAEMQLRYNPYAPTDTAENRKLGALLFDHFTVTGAAFDNIDNNLDGRVDEHRRCGSYFNGLDYRPGWIHEIGNTFSSVGRINVNTAPKEVLMCLNVPNINVGGRSLAERLADKILAKRPFTSMQDLLQRTRTEFNSDGSIKSVGFDYFGCDGQDNHDNVGYKIDGWSDPDGLIDDADEAQHLYTLNSEVLSVRSDTFAVYFRVQVLLGDKVRTERRVFSIWDRAACLHPQFARDGTPNADYSAPRCLATQVFGY